jgi:hypothetical protein
MAIPSSELSPDGERKVLANRKRIPKITHIQFSIKKENLQRRLDYKAFVEDMREKYRPKPEEGIFPTIKELGGKHLKVDITGRLYFTVENEDGSIDVEELSPQESEAIWKSLWKEKLDKILSQ